MRDTPNLVRAKFIVVPFTVVLFLIFTALELKSYLSQLPVLSLKLSSPPSYPVPALLFAFPWGTAVDAIISAPINVSSVVNPNLRLSDLYDVTIHSMDNIRPPSTRTIPHATFYLCYPKEAAVDFPWRMTAGYNRREATNGFAPDNIGTVYTDVWVFGTRFTQGTTPINEYGLNTNFASLVALPNANPASILATLTQGSLVRDENQFFQNGGVQTTYYSLTHSQFIYINKSSETFYKVSSLGSSSNIGPAGTDINPRNEMQFAFQDTKTTIYSEYFSRSLTSVIASVMTAFQVILITGFILLFGRGRYSPYGLVHYVGGGIPKYEEESGRSQEEANRDRIDFFVKEYLDTRPLTYAGAHSSFKEDGKNKYAWLGTLGIVCAGCALALFLSVLFGGIHIRPIFMLKVSDASQEYLVSLWGYCGAEKCTAAQSLDLFGNFGFVSPSTISNPNLAVGLADEHNGLGLLLVVLNISLISAVLLTLLGASFLQAVISLAAAVPILAIVTFISSSLQFICLLYYYVSLRDLINARPFGVNAELGNGVAILCAGAVFCWVMAVAVIIDSILRRKGWIDEYDGWNMIQDDRTTTYNGNPPDGFYHQGDSLPKESWEYRLPAVDNRVSQDWRRVTESEVDDAANNASSPDELPPTEYSAETISDVMGHPNP